MSGAEFVSYPKLYLMLGLAVIACVQFLYLVFRHSREFRNTDDGSPLGVVAAPVVGQQGNNATPLRHLRLKITNLLLKFRLLLLRRAWARLERRKLPMKL